MYLAEIVVHDDENDVHDFHYRSLKNWSLYQKKIGVSAAVVAANSRNL